MNNTTPSRWVRWLTRLFFSLIPSAQRHAALRWVYITRAPLLLEGAAMDEYFKMVAVDFVIAHDWHSNHTSHGHRWSKQGAKLNYTTFLHSAIAHELGILPEEQVEAKPLTSRERFTQRLRREGNIPEVAGK